MSSTCPKWSRDNKRTFEGPKGSFIVVITSSTRVVIQPLSVHFRIFLNPHPFHF